MTDDLTLEQREPLDLDALEAQQDVRVNGRSYGPVEPIAALIAECRALRAEVELLTRELREVQQTVIKARFYPDVDEPPLISEVDPDD